MVHESRRNSRNRRRKAAHLPKARYTKAPAMASCQRGPAAVSSPGRAHTAPYVPPNAAAAARRSFCTGSPVSRAVP